MSHVWDAAGWSRTRASMVVWRLIALVIALHSALRLAFGPLAQDPSYHLFADTRRCGPIPHAGDVLTNLFILAAGVAGLLLRRRVHIEHSERAAYAMLVAGMLLTALGSMYYHWAPSDARLVWDRLPMTLVLGAVLALMLADRIAPVFAAVALWPATLLGIASILWWTWTRLLGADDLWLYMIVRVGTGMAIGFLLLLRRGRHSGGGWIWAALVIDLVLTLAERLDYEIYAVTGMRVSGHNVKHVLAGMLFGCALGWLAFRRPARVR